MAGLGAPAAVTGRIWSWGVAGAVALLATALRVHDLPGGSFGGDEALHWHKACEIARGDRPPPAIGFYTTDGWPMPAVFNWLEAAWIALAGDDPLPGMTAVAALNGLAAGALVLAARPAVGSRAAGLAGILLAVAPSLVLGGRKLWNPDLLVPAVVATLGLALRAQARPGARGAGPAVFMGWLTLAVHYTGLAALAAACQAWLDGRGTVRERLRRPGAWVGALAGLSLFLPFLLALSGARRGNNPDPNRWGPLPSAEQLAGLVGSGDAFEWVGPAVTTAAAPGGARWAALAAGWLLLVAAAAGLAWFARSLRTDPRARLIAGWTALATAPLFLGLMPARSHYLIGATPLLLVAAARLFVRAGAGRRCVRRAAVAALLAVVCGGQAFLASRLVRVLEERGGAPGARYGVAYRHQAAAAARVVEERLALRDFPGLAFLVLVEREGRRRGAAPVHSYTVPYWELEVALPVPAELRPGRFARVGLDAPRAGEALETWSHGPLWVWRTE